MCIPALFDAIRGLDLNEFYLRWNAFCGNGFHKAIQLLAQMENLRVLDLSWNLLGSDRFHANTSTCIGDLCDFLSANKTVLHMDLAGNGFNWEESDRIAKALTKNHTIYGFHFDGNVGYVDELGFLIVPEAGAIPSKKEMETNYYADSHLRRKINGVKSYRDYNRTSKLEELKEGIKNCCWICDGWAENNFSWVKGESSDDYD